MGTLYLDTFSGKEDSLQAVSLETFIVIHAIKSLDLLNSSCPIRIVLVKSVKECIEPGVTVNLDLFPSVVIGKIRKLARILDYLLVFFS